MAEGSFPIEDFEKKMTMLMERHLLQIASVFGLETFDTVKLFHPKLELKAQEGFFRNFIRQWIRTRALLVAKGLSNRIRALVRDVLVRQTVEDFGEREAVRRVASILSKGRALAMAQAIARTESHTAATVGQHEAAVGSGVDLVKEWGATEDHRTRPHHAAADGQTREMTDRFNVGDDLLLHPGDPAGSAKEVINCRCVALYWPRAVAPHRVTASKK